MEREIPGRVVHGGTLLWHRRHSGRPLLDFSANLNPFPPEIPWKPDPSALASYPDDRYEILREAIGRTFHRRPEEIAVGNGSMELIRIFCQAALSDGDGFHVEHPTFGEYELSARLAGGHPVEDPSCARVRFICNPNNPTGTLRSAGELRGLLRQIHLTSSGMPSRGAPFPRPEGPLPPRTGGAASRLLPPGRSRLSLEGPPAPETAPPPSESSLPAGPGILFLDEAFIELSDPGQSLAGVRDPALFILRSLTKAFAVPGLRFGYGFGDPDLISRMEVLRPPWSVNAFAEEFALLAFRNYHLLESSRRKISLEREWLEKRLRDLGIPALPSAANFLLVNLDRPASGLASCLLARGILVRDCASFGLPESIRIAVRRREENEQLTEALAACLP
jgi:threonine-phosphate decarboxylase